MPALRDRPPNHPPSDPNAGAASARSPLASTTPPPLSLASVREIGAKPGAVLPPDMLVAMRALLVAQGHLHWAAELDTLFDLETGRSRAV
jgi:hypothetical protein